MQPIPTAEASECVYRNAFLFRLALCQFRYLLTVAGPGRGECPAGKCRDLL